MRTLRPQLLVVLASVVCVLTACGGSKGHTSQARDLLLFRTTHRCPGLAIVAAKGGAFRRLARGVDAAAWSPDGRSVAYGHRKHDCSDPGPVVTQDVVSGKRRTLNSGGSVSTVWSPKGGSVALDDCDHGHRCGTFEIDVSSGARRRIASVVGGLVWAPNGRTLAIDTGNGIVIADGTGRHRRLGRSGDSDPSWSPDSQRLLVTRRGPAPPRVEPHADVYAIGLDGTETRITRSFGSTDARWAPDGRLAWVGHRRGITSTTALFVARGDGRRVRRVTPWSAGVAAPAWSPDGRRIAFLRSREFPSETMTLEVVRLADFHRRTLLTRRDFDPLLLAWQPSSRR